MKNARILIIAVLLLAAASVHVQAQDRLLFKATIPFAFTVENISLPAGDYTVSVLPPYNMIKVQSVDGRKVATIFAMPSPDAGRSEQTKLVFQRIGNQHFLIQVWEQGSDLHRDLRSGKLAQELVSGGWSVQSTTVLASNGSH